MPRKVTAKATKKVAKKTTKKPAKKIATKAIKKTTTRAVKKEVKKVPKKPAKKVVKKSIKKTAKKTTPKIKKRTIKEELKKDDFRVSIFGSARIKKNDERYKLVFDLAKQIGGHGLDIVTGGGPGMMEAANKGHAAGDLSQSADSIGLTIELPWEASTNKYLEIEKHFDKFSGRLDHFMALSSAVVITPGGIGTCLELFYTWQLTQVKHICPIPIILVGKMWKQLMKWVNKYPVKAGLISPKDLSNVYFAKNNKQAMKIILRTNEIFRKEGKNYCKNVHKYKLK